jgi:hypothetical protein
MHLRHTLSALAVVSIACGPSATPPPEQGRGDTVPDEISAAEANLFTMAMILSGEAPVQIRRLEDGGIRTSYPSLTETTPDWERGGPWLAFLKREADVDSSGDVDSGEAWRLRRRVELGLTADALPDIQAGEFRLLGYDGREELLDDIVAYQDLRERATSEGLNGLPRLSPALAQAVEQSDAPDRAQG